jgi:hypothetical protein
MVTLATGDRQASLCCTASGLAAASRAGSGSARGNLFATAAWRFSSVLLSRYLANFANLRLSRRRPDEVGLFHNHFV